MKNSSKFLTLLVLTSILLAACASLAPADTSPNDNTSVSTSFDGVKLNLNTVSADELLATIPGFSNRMVREFQEYRPYLSIQQFRREIGKYVSDAQILEYEKYVYVPIAINDSDSETLQQISGLDANEADLLIAARPFSSAADFLTALAEFISAEEAEVAKSYLGE